MIAQTLARTSQPSHPGPCTSTMAGGPISAAPYVQSVPASDRPVIRFSRDAPDHVAHVVRHQERAVRAERDPDRSPEGGPLVGSEEPRQDVARRPGGATVLERHEDDPVTTKLAAVPGTMLPDDHAIGIAGQGARGEPA